MPDVVSLEVLQQRKSVHKALNTFLIASGFAFIVSLIPTGTYKNLGYVDPNLYIGYGSNLSWLVQNTSFEYHATRLPLISLLHLLLFLPTNLFGFFFKFMCLNIISISWFSMCKNFNIHLSKSLVGGFVLLISPLVISSSSWTFANTFAAIISSFLLPLSTRQTLKKQHFLLIGIVIANVAILNTLFALLSFTLILPLIYQHNIKWFLKKFILIPVGALCMWVVYEIYWVFILRFPETIWTEQYKAIFGIDRWRNEYWQPITVIIENKMLLLNFMSFLLLGLILNIVIYFDTYRDSREVVQTRFARSGIYFSSLILLLYFGKTYIGFSELWYFYILLLAHALILISLLASQNKLLNQFLPISLVFCTITAYLKWQFNYNTIFSATALLAILIATLYGSHILVNYLKKNSRLFVVKRKVFIVLCSLVGWCLLFSNPSFGSAYLANDNIRNAKFLEEQLALMRFSKEIKASNGSIALWAGKDSSLFLGGLESTLGFHMIRIEGLGPASTKIELGDWIKIHGQRPKFIIVLLKDQVYSDLEERKYIFSNVSDYCISQNQVLPSGENLAILLSLTPKSLEEGC